MTFATSPAGHLPGTVLPLRVTRSAALAPLGLRCRCGTGRPATSDPALIRMAAHAAACQPGRELAAGFPAPQAGEQPVRLVRLRRRLALVCMCGAEATSWRLGSTSEIVRLKLHGTRPLLGADLTVEGLAVLLHPAPSRSSKAPVAARREGDVLLARPLAPGAALAAGEKRYAPHGWRCAGRGGANGAWTRARSETVARGRQRHSQGRARHAGPRAGGFQIAPKGGHW